MNFFPKIENKTWTKLSVSPSPPARHGHSAVLVHNSMYIFGGTSSGSYLDIFEFDLGFFFIHFFFI